MFIIPAALHHYLVVGVTFDTPHKTFACFNTLSKFTLLGRNIYFSCFIRKIAGKSAPLFAVIFVVAYSEKLPASKYAEIKNNIVRCAAIDIDILGFNRKNVFGLSRAQEKVKIVAPGNVTVSHSPQGQTLWDPGSLDRRQGCTAMIDREGFQ